MSDEFYDAERWREQVAAWAETLFDAEEAEATARVPSQPGAALAYGVTWSACGANATHLDVTEVARSAAEVFGPLARIVECDFKRRTMHFCVMDMPQSAKQQLMSVIENAEAMLGLRKTWSLRRYALLFGVAVLNFGASSLLLHNHWYSYEEPWETPLEFVYYHLPFVGGGHAH